MEAALPISAPAELQGMTIKYPHCKSLKADESVPRAAGTLQKILFRKSLPKTRKTPTGALHKAAQLTAELLAGQHTAKRQWWHK